MGGACGFFKNFPFQRLHFILHEAVQDVDLHMSAWLCLLLVSVRPCSEFISILKFSWNLEGREEGMGLTCFSFFFTDYTEKMQLS